MNNNYTITNYLRKNKNKGKLLSKRELHSIENRQLQALRMNNYSEIADAKTKVLSIIDKDGLENEDQKLRLDSAFKTLPYIMPQKKAIEVQVTTRKLEDIIEETIQEAEIISEEKQDNKADDSDKVQIQAKNKENDVR